MCSVDVDDSEDLSSDVSVKQVNISSYHSHVTHLHCHCHLSRNEHRCVSVYTGVSEVCHGTRLSAGPNCVVVWTVSLCEVCRCVRCVCCTDVMEFESESESCWIPTISCKLKIRQILSLIYIRFRLNFHFGKPFVIIRGSLPLATVTRPADFNLFIFRHVTSHTSFKQYSWRVTIVTEKFYLSAFTPL